MFEVMYALVHDEDTGKALEPPLKLGRHFDTKDDIEKLRVDLKRQKDNGHKVSIYFAIKELANG
jgi:hypothetical protein